MARDDGEIDTEGAILRAVAAFVDDQVATARAALTESAASTDRVIAALSLQLGSALDAVEASVAELSDEQHNTGPLIERIVNQTVAPVLLRIDDLEARSVITPETVRLWFDEGLDALSLARTKATEDIQRHALAQRVIDLEGVRVLEADLRVALQRAADRIAALRDGVDGVPGPQGPVGRPGDQGLAGTAGERGERGVSGDTGPAGPEGPRGVSGAQGEAGPAGEPGEAGPEGPPGPHGPPGPEGTAGPRGAQGLTGERGEQGPAGIEGPIGPEGQRGADGLAGAMGERGPQGEQGPIGLDGPVGPVGLKGDPGADGERGTDGVDGATGPMGERGADGLDGSIDDVEPWTAQGYEAGATVFHRTGIWRAARITDHEPGDVADAWLCLHPVMSWQGVWTAGKAYLTLAVVAHNGGTWIRNHEPDDGGSPGESACWNLLSKQGKTGRPGPEGAPGVAGPVGPEGQRGTDGTGIIDLTIENGALVAALSDGTPRVLPLPELHEFRTLAHQVTRSMRALGVIADDDQDPVGTALRMFRGAWSAGETYRTGDMVRTGNTLWLADQTTTQPPSGSADWVLVLRPPAGGGSTGGGGGGGGDVPDGGSTGQVLTKASDDDLDVAWATPFTAADAEALLISGDAVDDTARASAAAASTSAATANTNANNRVLKAGDTMTGRLEIQAAAPAVYFRYTSSGGGSAAFQSFSASTSLRWAMSFSANAETGANVGSDFTLNAYSDAGAFIGSPIAITRGTLGITLGGVVQINYGSAGAPALTFPFETTTGIYRSAANTIGFSASGTLRMSVAAAAITGTVPYRGSAGTAAAPSLSFSGDTNTGVYSAGADVLGMTTNGVLRLSVSATDVTSTLPITLPGNPTTALQAVPKQYVDAKRGALWVAGAPAAGEVLFGMDVPAAFTIPANLAGWRASAGVAATASTAWEVRKNGTAVGTITWAAAGTLATLATTGGLAQSFAVNDILEIVAAASADATLASVRVSTLWNLT